MKGAPCATCGRPNRRGGPDCAACYQRRYRSTPDGKRRHNDAVIAYNARNPDKRREWLRHSRRDVDCRRCGRPVGLPGDDLQAWALGYHDECWGEQKGERVLEWQEERRVEAAMRETRRQRRFLRIGAADLVRAARLLAERSGNRPTGRPRDPSKSQNGESKPDRISRN